MTQSSLLPAAVRPKPEQVHTAESRRRPSDWPSTHGIAKVVDTYPADDFRKNLPQQWRHSQISAQTIKQRAATERGRDDMPGSGHLPIARPSLHPERLDRGILDDQLRYHERFPVASDPIGSCHPAAHEPQRDLLDDRAAAAPWRHQNRPPSPAESGHPATLAPSIHAIAQGGAMSVTVRLYRRGGWEVDISVRLSDGAWHRERRVQSHSSRRPNDGARTGAASAATRPSPTEKAGAHVAGFRNAISRRARTGESPQAERDFGEGNDSSRASGFPCWEPSDWTPSPARTFRKLKTQLQKKAPKTVNNVLTVLNTLLKKAVEWDVITRMPGTLRLLPVPRGSMGFHYFGEYERLRRGRAKSLDPARLPHPRFLRW